MSALTLTHSASVTEDQIDHLGHMNVRFYGANARKGTLALLSKLRLAPSVSLDLFDVYTRHHREQLLGSELQVHSGVLSSNATEIRLYHELVNAETAVLAATFVHRLSAPSTLGSGAPLPPALVAQASEAVVEMPEHGRPRSVSLDIDPMVQVPLLSDLVERNLAMRKVRLIEASECGDDGQFRLDDAPGLTWDGEPLVEIEEYDDWLTDGPNGERMGWASMETRMVIRRLPHAGDRVQSFAATVGLGEKVSHRVYWVYDIDRGDLLTCYEVVGLAFDTNTRQAMVIPPHAREHEESVMHPDLFHATSTG